MDLLCSIAVVRANVKAETAQSAASNRAYFLTLGSKNSQTLLSIVWTV
jgi:hypothetical protein